MILGQLEIELAANVARLSADMRKAQGVVDQATGAMARAAGLVKMALGAMAGVLSVGAFAGFIKSAADATAGLHDMSIQTGASVASLMAFKSVAATTDTTIDDIGKAMNRFAKGMTAADEESKGIGRAVQSIGLDFNALKAMAPEQQMLTIAKALDGLENGALKASVAMTFYGKEGAAMLPYLGDLASQSSEITAMLTAQEIATQKAAAALADDFGDNLAKINKLGNDWARDLSNGMMPALVEVTGEILKAAEGAGGFAAAIRQATADGTVAEWTRDIIGGLKLVVAAVEPAAQIAVAYFAIFKVGPAVYTAAAGALSRLTAATATYAMNVAIGQANTIGLNTALFGTSVAAQLAAGNLTKAALAGNLLFAAFAGWQIGTYLEEQSTKVKIFAEVLTGAVLEMWEHIKLGSKLALDAMTAMWRTTFSGLALSLAPMYEGIAAGLRKIGFDEKAGQIEEFAGRVRKAADSQGTFASRTAEARTEHERNIKAIRSVTDSHVAAIVAAENVSEATRGVAAAAAAAGTSTKGLSKEQKQALKAAADFIEGQEKELEAIGKTEAQRRLLTAARAAAAAPEAAQKTRIMELAEAINAESESWELAEKARTAAATRDDDYYAKLRAGTEAIDERIVQMQREIDLHGLTASAAIDAERAKLEAKLAAGPATYAELAALDAQIEKLKELAGLARQKETLDAEKKANDQRVADQVKMWDSIERTAHDTFVSIQDGGKGMWRRLKESGQNIFFDWLYQMTAKKWLINVGTSMGLTGGVSGAAQAASAAGGSGGSAIGSIGSLVSTFGSMFGSTSIGAFGQGMGMTQMAAARMGGGAYSAGASATPILSVAGWIAAGMALADGLFKKGFDPNNGSVNTALTNPLIPGAMHNNKIFQALGMNERWANMFSGASVVTALFGRKNPEVQSSALWGNLTSETGFQGAQRDYWTAKGGLFRSDKDGYSYNPVSTETYEFLSDTYKALREATKGFAEAIGADASSIANRTDAINVAIGKTEEETQKNLTAYFEGLANTMAADLVPSLVNLQKSGESASATLQRLATDYAMVDQVLTSIGMAFAQVGVDSLAARERLINKSGGAESFAANTAGFAQNFLTEDERNAPVLAAVRKELDAMGLAAVDTREEFAAVVLGLNVANEAESERFGKLIQLQGAFAQVYPELEKTKSAAELAAEALELANRERTLDAQILRLQGDAAGALRIERELELAGMPELLHARQKHIWSLEDEATAQQAAAAVWEREREIGNQARSIEAQRLRLVGDAEGALRIERDLQLENLPKVLHEAQKYNWALEDQATAAKAAKDAADQLAAADAKRISDWSEMYNNAAAAQAKAEADRVAAAEKAAAEAKALADKGLSMDAQILRLQGDAAGALRIERELELAGIPDLLKARQQYIWSLQDEAEAAAKAKALDDQSRRLDIEIMRLTGDAAGALAAERAMELEALDPALLEQKRRIYALQDEAEATKTATEVIRQAQQAAATSMASFGNSFLAAMNQAEQSAKTMREFRDSLNLGSLSALDPDARYREAKRLYQLADPADTQAAQAFLQASKDRGADASFYQRDFTMVQEQLATAAAYRDAYAKSIPAMWRDFVMASTPPSATSSQQSVAQATADVSRVEAKVDSLIEKLGGTMEVVAESTSTLAEQFNRVTNGGQGMEVKQ